MLKIFVVTYALSLFFDLFKTLVEVFINFIYREPAKKKISLTARDTCFIIPCHNSEDVIVRTLFTLPQGFSAICVANACTDGTVSRLQNYSLGTPSVTVINIAKPGKMNAVMIGALAAREMGFSSFILIDDDVLWPREKEITVSSDAVATGLPVIPLYPHNWLEVTQMIEYLYMVISKRAQGILGNTIMASGAAGIYTIETFLNMLKQHDGQHIGDDLQSAHIHHSLGYKIEFNSSLGVVTEAPRTLSSWWKQRAKRWEVSPVYNARWIFKTIFGSQPVGWWIRWAASYRVFVFLNDIARIISLPYVIVHFPGTLVGVWAIAYVSFSLKATAYYVFYSDYRYRISPQIVMGILTYPAYSSLMWLSRLYAIPNGIVRFFKRKNGGIYV